jgi:hypothetical protein
VRFLDVMGHAVHSLGEGGSEARGSGLEKPMTRTAGVRARGDQEPWDLLRQQVSQMWKFGDSSTGWNLLRSEGCD